MSSLENTAALMESAADQKTLITEKLNLIIGKSVDISHLTLADSTMLSDLKEIDDRLQAEIRKVSEQSIEEERQRPEATSLSPICQALHCSVHHLKQLRQQLGKVQSVAEALDHFLATVREVKAEIPTLLANQDPNRQKNEANWEQGRHSWQAAMQRLQAAMKQSDSVDSSLNAVGMTLTMDGTNVTCQDVVKSMSKCVVEMEKKMVIASKKQREEELFFLEKVKILEHEKLNPVEICVMKIGNNFPKQSRAQEYSTPSGTENELALEPKRSRLEGENYIKTQREEAQTMKPDNTLRTKEQRPRQRSSQIKKEGEEKQSLVQRRTALLAAMREMKTTAEQLRLQEPSLPALQQRTRALTELESSLAGLLSEVQYIQDATSQSGILDEDHIREMEDLWEETTKAVTERLEQCCVVTELLRKFQSLHGELSMTLQRAENIISNKASYMGKDNLQRLHTKVQEIKVELNGLGDSIEEIRSISRQLHTRLRQIPNCSSIPFESEADALMDQWLDLSERTDSYLENLHVGLALWDGVLQLGTEVESWTNNTLTVFAQCPSFQTEDDIKSLKNEIATQEESIQRFQRRATEIQSLLQSTEPPLELQVVDTQVRKKIEQLKELVSEAEDVYRQMVTTKGQITGRMEECLTSLQMIQESLLTLSGPSVAAVLAKLKELCWQLHTQDEHAESLQEDVRVITSISGPESLLSLSVNEIQLQEQVRNTHQLFSKVEEQTEKNIQDLDRLQTETDHLEQWLHAAEEKTAKEEDLSHLQEEALQQSMRTELLSQLVSSLRSSNLHQLALLKVSGKLIERYHNFHTHLLGDLNGMQFSLSKDIEAFQDLAKSTQSWVEDLRQIVDSPLVKSPGSLSPIEQRLHCAQVVLNATTEGETRLEELRVTGDSLNCKLLTGDDLKHGIQETIQTTEEQWKNLLQSVEPHYSVLQADPQLTSIYLARRQEACLRVEELHHQTDQLPILFPWPGTAERTQTCLLAHELWEEANSLQLTLTSLSEQRKELADRTSNSIWKDLLWNEVDTRWSSLMAKLKGVSSCLEEGVSNEQHFSQLLQDCHHKLASLQERMSVCQAKKESSAGLNTDAPGLEALLEEITDIEKDILELATLKDSIIVSSTGEAQASLSQQVSNLQYHKRVLENDIRENLGLFNRNQRIQQMKEEASFLQRALKDLTENVGDLCGTLEVLPDIIHLKQQWCAIKDLDIMLTELDTRVNKLQRTKESSMMQEILPAEIISNITALFKDLGSLTSIFQQKKKECAENTANKMTEVISQLQQWSQRTQAKPALLSQAALDEGLQLQQALYEVLSEKHFVLDCLGAKVTKELEESASSVLNESETTVETLSKRLVSHSGSDVQLENVELLSRSKSKTPQSSSADETSVMGPSSATDIKENSERCQNDNKMSTNVTFHASETSQPSTEPVTDMSEGLNVEADASKQDKAYIPMQKVGISVMGASRLTEKDDDAFVPIQVPGSKISDVLHSKAQQESHHLTFTPQNLNLNIGSKADKGRLYTDTSPQSSKHKTLSGDNTQMLRLDLLPTLNKTLTTQEANTQPLEADTALPKPEDSSVSTTENLSEHLTVQPEITTNAKCQDIGVTTKKVFTIVLDVEPMDIQRSENASASNLDARRCSPETELCNAAFTELPNTGFPDKKPEPFTTPVSLESDMNSCHLAAQSETFTAVTNAQQQQMHCEDVCWSPDKIFTIVLDMELQPWDMQQRKIEGASSPDVHRCSQRVELCDAQLTEVSNEGFPEKKSGLIPTLSIPVSDKTDFKSHYLSSEPNSLMLADAELEEVTSASAKLPRKEHHIVCELKHNEVLTSIKSCNTVAEYQLTHTDATETTFPDVKQEKMTDFCHSEKQTVGSVLFSVEDSVQHGEEQVTVADPALNTKTSNEEIEEGKNTEEANDTECIESNHSKVTERRDIATLSEEKSEWTLPAALGDMGATQGQNQESMEPERTALCLSADLAAAETIGGSTKSSKHRSTMQDVLSEIQSLVERSNIINRTPHIDLNWYLKSSLGEPEIRLVRTVQQILACRYQPAQLSVPAMTKQLSEAEEYRHCVQQQVATMKNISTTVVCDPNALKKAEGQWNAALLDASATVQVKAAQLDQVKQYHRQMKITRAFLEVLAAEKEKMSLNALGSSALQAEKLHVLLQTMEKKKGMMEDLLRCSGQLSVHLSDAESSGALLAQLGDVQEEWRLLEGKMEQLHISILSQLLVGRAVLEAQAQLRLETLQRCEIRQQSHRKCHEDIRQHLSGFEARLSECATEQVVSYDKCVAQQRKVKLLMEDIHCLAGMIEELRAGCPMQGCGVGKDGELGALWRRWVSSRRGVGLLMAHTEQRGEEWKDITTSMEQCCSFLTSLQAEIPDSSIVSFTQDETQELLTQAEVYQAGLEQEQQALTFLEHQLEHALSLSTSQDFISPGPIGKTLVKIQENVRSLKERNLLVVAAAQAEEKERQQYQEEIGEVEKHMLAILLALEACSTPNKRQELREDLSTQKTKLKCVMDRVQSRYAEIPTDIGRLIQDVQLTLQRAEQMLMDKNSPVAKLANRVIQLGSGLEKVKELLEQRNPTVSEARNVLKQVWDELDIWHSSLMLLENEVQDLAEEHPDQAQLLTDQLTQPLQLYQNASQMAERHTAFLSKIPVCLQEFEDILSSATCWLGEAQLWLSTPCLFTTARSLQNHAKSLQLVLEDSERISHTLEDFRPVLAEVSTVCDMSSHAERLNQTDQQVQKMQCNVLEPLEQLLQAVAMVEEMEAELKTIEKNIPKIKTILSSVDISNITPMEHFHNREVILANVRSMQRTLEEIEKCKGELHIPQEANESLLVFSRARLLLQPLEELEQLTQQQASLLEVQHKI
ncbi:nesprin-2-like [Acanthochromis polyacanthus]|uniref:nesprin-2-like n=1 Tax=Acanthochromis polyacanthus TaxID=80966 RepID=UPI00223405E4|nr:nesprin-2-like [Acanthochromis polyacanthus]